MNTSTLKGDEMTTTSPIKQIEGLTSRLAKAREIVSTHRVLRAAGMASAGIYMVFGDTGRVPYVVTPTSCTCPDAAYRTFEHKGWCKHRLAVEIVKESQPWDLPLPEYQPQPKTESCESECARALDEALTRDLKDLF
jgi:predicted nucleic acid-binding Zn finger protein